MKNIKIEHFTIRCYSSHLKILKAIAKKEKCSVGDLLISRTLGIPLENRKTVGKEKTYQPQKSKTLAEVFQEEDKKIDPEVLKKEEEEFKEILNNF
jgi:hypothetical protein